ncbi:MAG TPA: alkaline phosphatase family protein [Hyphomicrobiaceae bacterium]|nr:alkaline phosphatase family protein [Hyphomicrobiaceae bacterium]
MINEASLAKFSSLGGGLLKPVYSDYSFANISNTAEFLLTGNRFGPLLPPDCFGGAYPAPKKVVVFFVDSFGWRFWQDHAHRFRATARVNEKGTLTPISALFPSTTAASVSTLNTGVLPARHAVYEWNMYVPAYGEVIQSLLFCPLGQSRQDACLQKGYDPALLLMEHETVHQRLARHGVRSLQFSGRSYAGSAYNRTASAGADVIRHVTLAEALVQLKETLLQIEGKALLAFYWATIDTIAHIYGPGTPYHAAEIAGFWRTFDEVFHDVASPDTQYLFIADHGQVRVDAKSTYYINERIPALADCLAVSPTGNPIYPNGSPRDMFLHVKPERREEVLRTLQQTLDGKALVMPMDEALGHGLFGAEPVSDELRRRLGDILILPEADQFIWWRQKGIMANHFNGHHGGLAPDELITVFGAVDSL